MQISITGHFDGSWEEALALSEAERHWVVVVQHRPGSEPLHEHPISQVIFLVRGSLTFLPRGSNPIKLEKGHIARIPANVPHRVKIHEETVYLMQLERGIDLDVFVKSIDEK